MASVLSTDDLIHLLTDDSTKKQTLSRIFQSQKDLTSDTTTTKPDVKLGLIKTVNGSEEKESYVWFFCNPEKDSLLIVGDEASADVVDKFTAAGMQTYIDRTQATIPQIRQALENCVDDINVFVVECALCETYDINTFLRVEEIMKVPSADYVPYEGMVREPEMSHSGRIASNTLDWSKNAVTLEKTEQSTINPVLVSQLGGGRQ